MSSIHIIEADLCRPEHQVAVLDMVNAYAMDPLGNGKPLADEVAQNLIPGLQKHPTTLIFLAYDEEVVGIAVCFYGFSTFAARQLINIHDLSVLPEYRGKGIGRKLLKAVEMKARKMDCCKLTLEVLENNHLARHLYEAVGFAQAEYQPGAGGGLFYSKLL